MITRRVVIEEIATTVNSPHLPGPATASVIGDAEDPRAAMRAYLQRGEVRLSTMHRVAGAFLSGAGLLVLLPAFLLNILSGLIQNVVSFPGTYIAFLGTCLTTIVVLPVFAIYLLFRDLVEFYFVRVHPGSEEGRFFPRFVLSGLSIPADECRHQRDAITQTLMTDSYRHFLVPEKDADSDYLRRIYHEWQDELVPKARRKFILPDEKGHRERVMLWTAFGMTGTSELSLIEEVAKTEVSLARHAFLLRRLVLRYAKAFLLFVATMVLMIVSFSLTESDRFQGHRQAGLVILISSFQVWAVAAPWIVRLPIHWIWRSRGDSVGDRRDVSRDPQLVAFENWVFAGAILLALASAMLPVLTFLDLINGNHILSDPTSLLLMLSSIAVVISLSIFKAARESLFSPK